MDIRKSYAKSNRYADPRNATSLILVPFDPGPFSLGPKVRQAKQFVRLANLFWARQKPSESSLTPFAVRRGLAQAWWNA